MTMAADRPIPPALSAAPARSAAAARDDWAFVAVALFFLFAALVGFVPDSIVQLGNVRAGLRQPFTIFAHVHAALMGSWLLLLVAQSWLAATGRTRWHRGLGMAGIAIMVGMVVAGALLSLTLYVGLWQVVHNPPPALPLSVRAQLPPILDNLANVSLSALFGFVILFPLLVVGALIARRSDPGLHKRLILLATATTIKAAITRMSFLPAIASGSPLAPLIHADFYMLAGVMPLFVWDLYRLRRIHRAYPIWLAAYAVASAPVYLLWNTPWWLATLPRMLGLHSS
jgi:hypothetical protein